MKIKSFIAIGIIGLLIGLTGCEKDENRVILTDPVKPQLKTVPDLTLLEENEADTLVFVGTPLDPGFTASIIYSLETCETGNNFANKITLFSDIQDERMTVKVGFLNNLLLANYEANTPLSFDFRIKYYDIYPRTNNTVGEAKYRSCTLCTGDYLLELDHDDYLLKDSLSYIIEAFKQYPDAGFAYSNAAEIDELYNYF
mgnify:CR=1 FL=1